MGLKRDTYNAKIKFIEDMPDTLECVLWPFELNDEGYGNIYYDGKSMGAHRYSLAVYTGGIPDLFHACHKPIICHNPSCVNPHHLYWGTNNQNLADMRIDNKHRLELKAANEGN